MKDQKYIYSSYMHCICQGYQNGGQLPTDSNKSFSTR